MDCPRYILEVGTWIKTHAEFERDSTKGMLIVQRHLDNRRVSQRGQVSGIVAGHGGDVYWVRHEGDSDKDGAAYGFWEFELEPIAVQVEDPRVSNEVHV